MLLNELKQSRSVKPGMCKCTCQLDTGRERGLP